MSETQLNKISKILSSEMFNVKEPISNMNEIKKFPNWDSFKHLLFLIEIEKNFGIEITPEEFKTIVTIGDITKRFKNDN